MSGVAIAFWFIAWHAVFSLLDRPLYTVSRFYRSLALDEKRFLRAYITRSCWACLALFTSLSVQNIIPTGLFTAEQMDVVNGWSAINDILCPITVGFAFLENYLEMRDHIIPALLSRIGGRKAEVSIQMSLIIHHFLFLCAVSYTWYTKSLIYYSNLLNMWEGTAPISFLVWLSQKRYKWQQNRELVAASKRATTTSEECYDDAEEDDCVTIVDNVDAIALDDAPSRPESCCSGQLSESGTLLIPSDDGDQVDVSTTLATTTELHSYLSSDSAVYRLMLIRILVWILFRQVLDLVLLQSLWTNSLLPFAPGSDRLRFGNKVQLWLAAPLFVFGLNPFWLYLMVKCWYQRYHGALAKNKKVN